jgi:hypothetical protein
MHVPINDMQVAEDIHMLFDHMMMRVMCSCETRNPDKGAVMKEAVFI